MMFLVESHAIPDLTFEGWGLLVQALAVEFVPDLGRCLLLLVLVKHQGGCGREAITVGVYVTYN